jgi:hypothetical protein
MAQTHDIKARRTYEDAVVNLRIKIEGEWGEYTMEREVEVTGKISQKGKRGIYGDSTITVTGNSINKGRLETCIEEIGRDFGG